MNGFLFIDKEKGVTSFDVIRSLKRRLREDSPNLSKKFKIGHSGTLDPIATGLMIVALGEATKLLEFLLGADKIYQAECEFGVVSDTYDADGKMDRTPDVNPVSLEAIEQRFQEDFTGDIMQVPPKFSAKKINGKRAYDLAREGKEVNLESKKVHIYDFKILSYDWPLLRFEVSCGSGMYVRSLVHDLGEMLEVGACMTALRRTGVGFLGEGEGHMISIDNAKTVEEELEVHSLEEVFEGYPLVELNGQEHNRLSHGGFVLNKKSIQGDEVLAWYSGKIVGVLTTINDGKFVKFRKQIKISA